MNFKTLSLDGLISHSKSLPNCNQYNMRKVPWCNVDFILRTNITPIGTICQILDYCYRMHCILLFKVFYIISFSRTYYNPQIIKDDGHLLHLVVKQMNSVIETSFELKALNQFDQVSSYGNILKYLVICWIVFDIISL